MSGKNIMVIDDQPGIRLLLNEALSRAGFKITLASSGHEALKKIITDKPELIILDVRMPGMDGIEFLKELGRRSFNIPVIFITAYGELELGEEVRKQGVQYFLQKPFDINELYRLLDEALDPETTRK